MAHDISEVTERMREVLAPLSDEEERRAIDAALAALADRLEDPVIRGVELLVNKPRRRGDRPDRHLRVVLTERFGALAHEVVLGSDGALIAARELGPLNLPYTPEEIEQAHAVAVSDEHVGRQLVDRNYRVGSFGPALDDSGHRLVGLHFVDITDPNIPQPIISAVVDLAAGVVIEEPNHLHEHGESGGS